MTPTASKTKITGRQLFIILVLTRLVPMTIAFPSIHKLAHIQHGWISVLAGTLLSVPLFLLVIKLGQTNPEQSVIEYVQRHLWSVAGKAVGVLLSIYFLVVAIQVVRAVADALAVAMMPRTPTAVLVVVITLVSAYASRHGIEVIARLGELIFLFSLISMVLIALLPYDAMRADRLFPLFPGEWHELIPPVVEYVSFYCQFTLVLLVIPHLEKPHQATSHTIWAMVAAAAVSVLVVVSLTVTLGTNATNSALPTLRLAQMIQLGKFVERTESVVLVLWTWIAAVKAAAFIWATSVALKRTFGLRTHQHLVFPVSALVAVFGTVFFGKSLSLQHYLEETWAPLSIATVLVVLIAGTLSYAAKRLSSVWRPDR